MMKSQTSWMPSRRAVLWLSAGLLLLLGAGPPLVSWMLRNASIKRILISRMEASFGRPVEVGDFSVSLLGGLRVEANYVTVSEDSRFGSEFFLRAEQITASLRWPALLRGRLEFGDLALLRPSVNLVRNSEGQWNLLAWLPPAGHRFPASAAAPPLPRLYRITVDSGRVNFKTGPDKRPFALNEVNGSFTQTSSGNWQADFVAQAFRAGAIAQEPGELRVRGTMGGPQSRIVPADILITWDEASLADVLRLLRGRDFGLRGNLAGEVRLRSDAADSAGNSSWEFTGSARVDGLHGWQLPPRTTDPAINFQVEATWRPSAARLAVKQALLESAHSSIRASGEIRWGPDASFSSLRFRSAGLAMSDALAFYRAFRTDVSPQAQLEGVAALDAEVAGWPPRIEAFRLHAPEGQLTVPGLERPFSFRDAAIQFNSRRQLMEFLPLTIVMLPDVSERARRLVVSPVELHWEGEMRPRENWAGKWVLTGQARSAKTIQAVGAALGLYSVNAWQSAGWEIEGPLTLKLEWQTSLFPFRAVSAGHMESRQARIASPLFVEPVTCAALRVDFENSLKVAFTEAAGMGGVWSGTLTATAPKLWEVSAVSSRLNTRLFDQALGLSADSAPHGLAAALAPAAAPPGTARLRAKIAISPALSAPFLEPLRPRDLSVEGSLELAARRAFRLSGALGAVNVTAPPIAQR